MNGRGFEKMDVEIDGWEILDENWNFGKEMISAESLLKMEILAGRNC